jgi:hypothetical protein
MKLLLEQREADVVISEAVVTLIVGKFDKDVVKLLLDEGRTWRFQKRR